MQVTVHRNIDIGHRTVPAWVTVVHHTEDDPAHVSRVVLALGHRVLNQVRRIQERELDRLVLSVTRREWQEAEAIAHDEWAADKFGESMIFG